MRRIVACLALLVLFGCITDQPPSVSESLDRFSPATTESLPFPMPSDPLAFELEAVRYAEAIYGPESVEVANVLSGVVRVLSERGEYEEALRVAERAHDIAASSVGPNHRSTAGSLFNVASMLSYLGRYGECIPLFRQVLSILDRENGPDSSEMALCKSCLARALFEEGEREEARIYCEQALATREALFGSDHPEAAESLDLLAMICADEWRYDEARTLAERALTNRMSWLGADHPETAKSLHHLACLLRETGLLDEARPLFEQAVGVWEESLGSQHPFTAMGQEDLAGLYVRQGLFQEADDLYDRALSTYESAFGSDNTRTISCLMGLAMLRELQGRTDEELKLLEKAVSVSTKRFGRRDLGTAACQGRLGLHHASYGNMEKAIPLLNESFETRLAILGPEHPVTALSYFERGKVFWWLWQAGAALTAFDRAIAIWNEHLGPGNSMTAGVQQLAARVELDLGDYEGAFHRSMESFAAAERHIDNSFSALNESERIRALATVRERLVTFLSAARLLGSKEAERDSHRAVLRWKGRVFRNLLTDRQGSPPSTREGTLLVQLRAAQRALSDAIYEQDNLGDDHSRLRSRLERLRDQRSEIETELSRVRSSSGRGQQVSDSEGFHKEMMEAAGEAAVIDFLVHEIRHPSRSEDGVIQEVGSLSAPHLTAWILLPGSEESEVMRVDFGDASIVTSCVREFLSEILSAEPETRGLVAVDTVASAGETPANDRLREILWKPIAARIGRVGTVIISTDSFLGGLPFEVIQKDDGGYLIEDHSFVYQHDLLGLTRRREWDVPHGEKSLLAVGGVDYQERDAKPSDSSATVPKDDVELRGLSAQVWKPLAFSGPEVEAIATFHATAHGSGSPAVLLTDSAATEERVKREIEDFRFVHLATHGYFQPEGLVSMWKDVLGEASWPDQFRLRETKEAITGLYPGLLSGLVFAGANSASKLRVENGLLTAEEVTFLDLSSCDLVVLSACETGLGRPESGEGMIGLRRSFRIAGARTVISSLWSVKDEATSNLMTRFYKNLWVKEMGKLEALRTAQLEVLERNREEHGHGLPSTWGAFVLDGDWR